MSARPDDTGASANRDHDVLARAAEWFALLAGPPEQISEEDRLAWKAWLAADPAHADAWRRVEALNARFQSLNGQLDRTAASSALQAMHAPSTRRRSLKLLGVAGLAAGAGWLTLRTGAWDDLVADAHTATGERRDLTLADGTRLWLNTDTAVQIRYTDAERQVRLLRGEVLVETAPDARGRPWWMATPSGSLRPMGTRFSVWVDGDTCRLAVFEGRVDARPGATDLAAATSPDNATAGRVLTPGEQVSFTRTALDDTLQAPQELAAWTQGLLVADGLPLGEVCRQLQRHQQAVITCGDDVAGLRVVGTFPLDQPDRIFEALMLTLPVSITRPLPWWVRVTAA